MWRFFAAEYSYCKELVDFFRLRKRMSEPHFQIFTGNTQDGTDIELIITGASGVKAAMAAGYVMAGKSVGDDDVCVCVEPSLSVEASTVKEKSAICVEIHDMSSDRYFYPDICPAHDYEEYSSQSEIFAALYESLVCFFKQHQLVFFKCADGWSGSFADFMKIFQKNNCGRHPFHHVYIERKLAENYDVDNVLKKLPGSRIVWINHYKDVFNRKNQSLEIQKKSPALILAKKEGQLIYSGSKECQDFGNDNFYYTSCMMNCLFDCEYCYLQGMYPSADVVLFMNLEDIFNEVVRMLTVHPVYLCVSYDTDLIALENITGYCRRWIEFSEDKKGLTIELRTKAQLPENFFLKLDKKECENIIFAFTLSTDMVQLSYEHNTPSVRSRIDSAKRAIQKGLNVRLCFDPLLVENDLEGQKTAYRELVDRLFEYADSGSVYDVSLGEFRVPCDYMKRMRKRRPGSSLLAYPFEIENGSFCCGEAGEELADYVEECLERYLPQEKIYRWRQ